MSGPCSVEIRPVNELCPLKLALLEIPTLLSLFEILPLHNGSQDPTDSVVAAWEAAVVVQPIFKHGDGHTQRYPGLSDIIRWVIRPELVTANLGAKPFEQIADVAELGPRNPKCEIVVELLNT